MVFVVVVAEDEQVTEEADVLMSGWVESHISWRYCDAKWHTSGGYCGVKWLKNNIVKMIKGLLM